MTAGEKSGANGGRSFSGSKIFFYACSVLIFVFAAYYFSEIERDVKLFQTVNPLWLGVALLAQAGTYFFQSLTFRALLEILGSGRVPPLRELFRASLVTLFINQTIPSAGASGNLFFFSFLKKKGIPQAVSFSLILVELLTFYAAAMLLIAVLLGLTFVLPGVPEYFMPVLGAGIGVYGLFTVLISLVGRRKSILFLERLLSRIAFLRRQVERYGKLSLRESENPWRTIRGNLSVSLQSVLFQGLIFGSDALTIFALAAGLGVPVQFWQVLLVLVMTRIVAVLPLSPGALVIYEGSMVFFFSSLGVPLAGATVVTLLYRILSFWLPIPVGFLLYRRWQLGEGQGAAA